MFSFTEWNYLSNEEKLKQIDPYNQFNNYDKDIAFRVIKEKPFLSKNDLLEEVNNEVKINRINYCQF